MTSKGIYKLHSSRSPTLVVSLVGSLVGTLLVPLFMPGMGVQAQTIGTLFTTREERDYLDYLRQDFVNRSQLATFNIVEDVIPEIPESDEVETITEEAVIYRFGGIIANGNGTNNIWLNGRLRAEQDLPEGITLARTTTGSLLNIRAEGNSYQLKAGQSIDMRTGNILESYQLNATDNIPEATTEASATEDSVVALNESSAGNDSAEPQEPTDATPPEEVQATDEDDEVMDENSPEIQAILQRLDQLQRQEDAE